MNSKYKYAIGVEISLNMSPSLAGPPTGTLFQTIITAGRNFYLKLFKVEGQRGRLQPMIRRLVSHYKGTGDVKTWGHIGVKNDLKFVHDIWNFARMRILDRSNFPINFKFSLSVCPSVCLSIC